MKKVLYTDELAHYGVLGMKWGVKKEYIPVGRKRKGTSNTYNRKHKSNINSKKPKPKRCLTDKQKKAIKIGAAIAGAALVTYGAYKLSKSGKLDTLIGAGKDRVNNLPLHGELPQGLNSEIKRLKVKESTSQAILKANPFRGTAKGKNNCTSCAIATFLRTDGYDVTAISTEGKPQNLLGVVEEVFKNVKTFDGSAVTFGKSVKDASEMLVTRFGNNASGVCGIKWISGYGHSFNWETIDGNVRFFDGKEALDHEAVTKYWSKIDPNGSLQLARLDNAEVNLENLFKYVNQSQN